MSCLSILLSEKTVKGDVCMNITIVGRKCSPRDSFKERAAKKLSKLDRFFEEEAAAKITVGIEKSNAVVEVTVNNDGMIFRTQERCADMNDALDSCVDSLVRKIIKNKTKVEKRLRKGALDGYMFYGYSVEDESDYEIVRTKNITLKPQTVDEAVLQMNMLGHQFYMFLNEDINEVSVVYRRSDEGYGLLIPDIE